MNRTATRWTGGRSAGVGILILGLAFAIAPQAQGLDNYNRTFGVCMSGRGYTVG
jgi:hypothetical protein